VRLVGVERVRELVAWCPSCCGTEGMGVARGVGFGASGVRNGVVRCALGVPWSRTGAIWLTLSALFPALGVSGDGEGESSCALTCADGERLGSRGMMSRDWRFAMMGL
jgi:hypothetical protein